MRWRFMPVATPVGSTVCRPYSSIQDAHRAATRDSSFGAGRKPCRESDLAGGSCAVDRREGARLAAAVRQRRRPGSLSDDHRGEREEVRAVLWLLHRGSVSACRLLSSKQRSLSCSRLKSWPRRAVARPRPYRSGRSIRWTLTWHPCLCPGRRWRSRARCRNRRRTSGPSGSMRSAGRRRCCSGGPGRSENTPRR